MYPRETRISGLRTQLLSDKRNRLFFATENALQEMVAWSRNQIRNWVSRVSRHSCFPRPPEVSISPITIVAASTRYVKHNTKFNTWSINIFTNSKLRFSWENLEFLSRQRQLRKAGSILPSDFDCAGYDLNEQTSVLARGRAFLLFLKAA